MTARKKLRKLSFENELKKCKLICADIIVMISAWISFSSKKWSIEVLTWASHKKMIWNLISIKIHWIETDYKCQSSFMFIFERYCNIITKKNNTIFMILTSLTLVSNWQFFTSAEIKNCQFEINVFCWSRYYFMKILLLVCLSSNQSFFHNADWERNSCWHFEAF